MIQKTPKTFKYVNNRATLANVDILEMVKKHQTPLYILDQETIEANCNLFISPLASLLNLSAIRL